MDFFKISEPKGKYASLNMSGYLISYSITEDAYNWRRNIKFEFVFNDGGKMKLELPDNDGTLIQKLFTTIEPRLQNEIQVLDINLFIQPK